MGLGLRVRTDFTGAQRYCNERRKTWRTLKENPCNLPDDCDHCKRYVCNACENVKPWFNGAADSAPGLCDDCWAKYIGPWEDAQDLLEYPRNQLEIIWTPK